MEADGGWTPYLSLDDAYRLDEVRDALRAGDVKLASRPTVFTVLRRWKPEKPIGPLTFR